SEYEAYAKRLTEKTKALTVGNGLDESVDIGPIINQDGYEKIVHDVDDAVDKGAHVLLGAEYYANEDEGYCFVQPTILKDVTDDMTIMQEDTFGPVVPVTTFSSLDEAIEEANNTPFGLAAYFFTESYKTGAYLFENLDYGIIGWNDGAVSAAHAPFG